MITLKQKSVLITVVYIQLKIIVYTANYYYVKEYKRLKERKHELFNVIE